jgi:outer membrane protein OmpA-like peptidoglycan-associated protein
LLHDLNQVDDVTGIRIEGFTDRLGSDSYNRQLSTRRAETVKRYLQDGGVKAPIAARGRGKEEPVVQCNDRNRQALIDCLAPNRRVELDFARGSSQTSNARQFQSVQSQRLLQDQQSQQEQ